VPRSMRYRGPNALAGSACRRGSACFMVVHAVDVLGAAATQVGSSATDLESAC